MWKDLRIRFTAPAEWLFFLVLPVAFTFILAGGTSAYEDNRIRLVVADQAVTPLSQELISLLEKSDTVRPELLPLDKAEEELAGRRVSAVLVIPAGLDTRMLQQGTQELELRQLPNSLNAQAATQAVMTAAWSLGRAAEIAASSTREAKRIKPFASQAERDAYYNASLQAAQKELNSAPQRTQVVKGATKDTVEYDPRANSSAGQLITWVFIPLFGISAMFADERQRGTLRRLLVTPSRKSTYLAGTLLGQALTAFVQMLILAAFGYLIMNVNWGREPLALAVIMVSSILAAASLGTMLGAFVKTEAQANGLSIMLGMVMALLSGCWYPLELFPQFIQTVVRALPTTWSMQGMLDILTRGGGVPEVLPESAVLLGFVVVFMLIGIWRFKYE